ncbi:unnamed protein product [Sphagnum jensenii]|uniref:Uncharacterized protein n=1 Tax=Sphagnum jensenii TaxID=128206 RepID=A0ABP1BSB6_9BRYO
MQEENSDHTPDPTCGLSPVAIAFKWEKEPGVSIVEEEGSATAAAAEEQALGSLPPPPGCRKARKRSVLDPRHLTFSGFEPEEKAPNARAQLADRICKKLVKVVRRRKSYNTAANCFSLDAFRGKFYVSDASEKTYDSSDEPSGSSPVSILFSEQTDTASSSSSSLGSTSAVSSAASSSTTRRQSRDTVVAPSPSPHYPANSQFIMANLLLSLSPIDDDDVKEENEDSEDGDKMSGPRECAWHQPQEEQEDDKGYGSSLPQESWQLAQYGPKQRARSSLLCSLSRQASKIKSTQSRVVTSSRLWEEPRSSWSISRAETR